MALMMSGDSGISAFPEDGNIFRWKGTIPRSFEGIEYKLFLSFYIDYPFKPPKVYFETFCFHPNVDVYGDICLDILESLLGEPNTSSPLNCCAAKLWENQEEYRKMVEKLHKTKVREKVFVDPRAWKEIKTTYRIVKGTRPLKECNLNIMNTSTFM